MKLSRVLFLILTLPLLLSGPALAGDDDSNGQRRVHSTDILAPFLCDLIDPTTCNVIGTSTIYRSGKGVGINMVVNGLSPNAPHTVWMLAFNKPKKCAGYPDTPCGFGDLGNPAVQAAVFWATGNYTDGDGNGFFQAFVAKGDASREQLVPGVLSKPRKAEIHFIFREHPYVPGEEHIAINTADGSCPNGVTPPDPPGPGVCTDVASAVHWP